MIRVDDRQIRALERRLKSGAPKALGHAARNTLDRAAFDARKQWHREMESTLTLRNRWTKGSVRVEKVRGLNVRTMQSRVGSLADYMRVQEDSGTIRGRGKEGYRYPSARAKPKGKMVRPRFRMKRLQLDHPKLAQFSSTRQKIAVATRMARARGAKFVFLGMPASKGMYQLMGSKRRPKMRLLWDMRRGSVHIPKHPTLGPAEAKVRRRMPRYAAAEFLKQLKRAKLA